MIDFVEEEEGGTKHKITKREKKIEIQLKNKLWNNKKNSKEYDPSPRFSSYYKAQFKCLQEEWLEFRTILAIRLPISFRYSIDRFPISSTMLRRRMTTEFNCIRGKYVEINGKPLSSLANPIVWSPNSYQISSVDAHSLNSTPELLPLSQLLIRESNLGHICKQELVSTLPAILLTLPSPLSVSLEKAGKGEIVHSKHNILDVCASPGSKTDQLISLLYESYHREKTSHSAQPTAASMDIPQGMIVANDADTTRIQTIRDRYVNYNCPNLLITCARAEDIHAQGVPKHSFNHILADVPCSGDGTFRKSPHLWRNFRPRTGMFIHSIQLQIALASIDLLSVELGSRFVYSTCSLNPLEDEAVVCDILRKHSDTLRLVDLGASMEAYLPSDKDQNPLLGGVGRAISDKLQHLRRFKWRSGLSWWRTDVEVMVNEEDHDILDSDEEVDGAGSSAGSSAGDGADERMEDGGEERERGRQQLGGKRKRDSKDTSKSHAQKQANRQVQQEKQRSIDKLPALLPSMLPPSAEDEAKRKFHLDRAMRVMPHDQDTGGFFIAVFERYAVPHAQTKAESSAASSSGKKDKLSVNAGGGNISTGKKEKCGSKDDINDGLNESGVTHEKELSILKNICGFNPKQISLSAAERESMSAAETDSALLLQWRKAVSAYNYERVTPAVLGRILDSVYPEASADDRSATLNEHNSHHLLLCTHPYEKPEGKITQKKVAEAVAAAAAAAEEEKKKQEGAAGAHWKGLKFLSALATKPSVDVKPAVALVQEPNIPNGQTRLCYLTFVSQNIKEIIHQWGHAANLGRHEKGESGSFSTYSNGLIVQGGVEVFSCIGNKDQALTLMKDPVGVITAADSSLVSVEVNTVSHNNILYASKHFPALVTKTIPVSYIDDVLAILQWGVEAGSAITISELESIVSQGTFSAACEQLVGLRVRDELVLKLKLTISNKFLYENHVAATPSGVSKNAATQVNSDSASVGEAAGAPRKGLSKMERKKLKKQQGQGQCSSIEKPAASAIPSISHAPVPTERIVEEFCILLRRGEDVCVNTDVEESETKVETTAEKCFFIRNPTDLCESMITVLTQYQKLHDNSEL